MQALRPFYILAAALVFVCPRASMAAPPQPEKSAAQEIVDDSYRRHSQSLIRALRRVGVKTEVTVYEQGCPRNVAGSYRPSERLLKICIDYRGTWTAYESGTLRHEAVHVLQHCKGGFEMDDEMRPPEGMEQLGEFARVKEVASEAGIDLGLLLTPYIDAAVSEEVLRLEAEAWTLMRTATETDLAQALALTCPLPADHWKPFETQRILWRSPELPKLPS